LRRERATHPEAGAAAPAELRFWINGEEAAGGTVERTMPVAFTASEALHLWMDTNAPVAGDYCDRAPFRFTGRLTRLHVVYQ
jgi:hypothetical protein